MQIEEVKSIEKLDQKRSDREHKQINWQHSSNGIIRQQERSLEG
jgi:hypothetical protein